MFPRFRRPILAATVLPAVAVAFAAAAAAQDAADTFDPGQLPAFSGKVAQYDLTPRGDVDGLILDDGLQIHFPPALGTEVVAIVRPGELVTVHGLKARALPVVEALSITDAGGRRSVVDDGPTGPGALPPSLPPGAPTHSNGRDLAAAGTIRMRLYGPRGDLNGVLLADGTMVHFPPGAADRMADRLRPGETVAVRGTGVSDDLGRAIDAREFGPSADRLSQLLPPPPAPRLRDASPPPPPPPV